jgi:RNase P subunit RPR2
VADKVLIFCPKCSNKDTWKIEVESRGKKRIVTITCVCGWSQQYSGSGESIYK